MNFLNPYSYIGGAIILAIIGGSLWYQGTQIHHWHVKYDTEHELVIKQQQIISNLKGTQNNQIKTTEKNVVSVVKIPVETQKIIKEVQQVPVPQDCSTPNYSQEIKNAF